MKDSETIGLSNRLHGLAGGNSLKVNEGAMANKENDQLSRGELEVHY
jgi:hypothetical protein